MLETGSKANTSYFQSHLKRSNLAFTHPTPSKNSSTQPKRANFVLLDHFSMSSFSVALDTLVTLNLVHDNPIYECKTYSVNNNKALSDISIEIATDGNIQDIEISKDSILVICGGFRNSLKPEPLLNKKLAKAAQSNATIIGIWNGSFYIADSKIKTGTTISIHQDNKAIMEERFPELNLSTSTFTEEGTLLTCSGPNSTLDMMLHFIKGSHGTDYSQAVAEVIGSDRSNKKDSKIINRFLLAESHTPDCIKESIQLMENNVEDPLTIDELTKLVGISRRQIERLFKTNVGVTPARYYMEYRLTHARQLIQQSNLSIFEISVACGFVSSAHFSRTYHRFFGQSPIDSRRTSQAS
ncbi:MAG: helix-turn-helix domain-containing protein [Gammaproteobacteria bacterium]|jgi:transcriptional regulator GlxA family with amidase domain|nr:helix-turn-helix domain-containing protein [Gammaproteobacteria bacterium]MBU2319941.1 helix-turn-helix domain-containing protein [Gammaproteobacteria bacterium]MBU2413990.1 helix-turn-helix domain-containing protein [Gammaproteobacteria bacterium]